MYIEEAVYKLLAEASSITDLLGSENGDYSIFNYGEYNESSVKPCIEIEIDKDGIAYTQSGSLNLYQANLKLTIIAKTLLEVLDIENAVKALFVGQKEYEGLTIQAIFYRDSIPIPSESELAEKTSFGMYVYFEIHFNN